MPFISLFGMVKQHLKAFRGHSSQVLVIIKYYIYIYSNVGMNIRNLHKKSICFRDLQLQKHTFLGQKKNLYLEGESVLRQKKLPTLSNFCNPGPLCIEPESPYISFNLECLIFFYNLIDVSIFFAAFCCLNFKKQRSLRCRCS